MRKKNSKQYILLQFVPSQWLSCIDQVHIGEETGFLPILDLIQFVPIHQICWGLTRIDQIKIGEEALADLAAPGHGRHVRRHRNPGSISVAVPDPPLKTSAENADSKQANVKSGAGFYPWCC